MKYLLTIFLFLSINVFTADRYVVCEERELTILKKCVNDYLDQGYNTLGGLSRAIYSPTYVKNFWYQSLIKE